MKEVSLPDGWLKTTIARSLFALFTDNGLGPYDSWLTTERKQLARDELVEAAKVPEVLDDMRAWSAMMRHRLAELDSIMAEAHATKSV